MEKMKMKLIAPVIELSPEAVEAVKAEAVEGTPLAHNRIRAEKARKAEIRLCKELAWAAESAGDSKAVEEGDTVYFVREINLGTKKWPHMIPALQSARVTKITEKTIFLDDGRKIIPDLGHRIIAIGRE